MNKLLTALATAASVAYLSVAALAGDGFAGTWSTKDTKGNDLKISLMGDGKATADRAGEGMSGTWTKDGDTAVIKWDSGWTTKIMKSGDGYTKAAYEKGAAVDGDPTHKADAKKVE